MKLLASPDDRGLRLDHFLVRNIDSLTRSQIQLLNRSGAILIDGLQAKSGYRIRGGESIEVNLDFLRQPTLQPEQIPIQIHYEDQDIAIVEKPAGLVVHPGSGVRNGTVVHALLHHFQNLSSAGGEGRPGIVHRLDKWTSGLLIVAKNNAAHAILGKAFHERRIHKTYIALVHGQMSRKSGCVDLSIGRHPTLRTRMKAQTAKGRAAFTEYETVDNFRTFTLLSVRIRTGRTHQIRVHLSAIGHPVVGDSVYGERWHRDLVKKYGEFRRYFLHAAELQFTHPVTGQIVECRSPLPADLQDFLARLEH